MDECELNSFWKQGRRIRSAVEWVKSGLVPVRSVEAGGQEDVFETAVGEQFEEFSGKVHIEDALEIEQLGLNRFAVHGFDFSFNFGGSQFWRSYGSWHSSSHRDRSILSRTV